MRSPAPIAFLLLCTLSAAGQSQSPKAKESFFQNQIQPLLARNCYRCHSQKAKRLGAGLLLDSRNGILKGGTSGPAAVPGHPEKSLLIQAVLRSTDLKMPPNGKLKSAEIDLLEQWIKNDLPWPTAKATTEMPGQVAEKKWPFYKPRKEPLPDVKNKEWVRNKIDNFILSRLEEKGLSPAPEASRRTLIRRLYFDLIGLPPEPKDVEAFLADKSPKAYENLVDRLLKSPQYGERWARFWLDLARYADTAGYEGDPDLPHAWRYRDYVIDAFNNDKPYDLFIKEQIAGDEFANILGAGDLPRVKPERIVALTFLRLAPFTEPRGDETRHELLSEMTSTVSSVFLGLTIGCARCHDHKYDAIPTADFYRMQAFFSTISIPRPEPGDGYQIGGPIPAAFHRPGEKAWAEKLRAESENEIKAAKQKFQAYVATLKKKLRASGAGFGIQSMGGSLGNNYFFDPAPTNDQKAHIAIIQSNGSQWDFLTDGKKAAKPGSLAGSNQGYWFGDLPKLSHISLGMHTEGTGAPKSAAHQGTFAEILLYDHPLNGSELKTLNAYIDQKYHSIPQADTGSPPKSGLRFWLDASDLDAIPTTANPKPGSSITAWTDKVTGIQLKQAKTDLQPVLTHLGKAKAPALRFDKDFLIANGSKAPFRSDQKGALVVVFSASHSHEGYGFEVGGSGAFISTVIYPNATTGPSLADAIADPGSSFSKTERREYYRLANRERFLKQQLKRLQPVAMSLRHSYGPPYEPGVPVTRIKIRGEYDNPGAAVKAGFPSCVTGHTKPAPIRLDPFKRWPTRSRRMALAEWIASKDNPLTARVMVNRLWQWHFGRGIVPTPSDFGKLSGGPSHPGLLDWLALKFTEKGWSIKAMHRLMVMSSTYRQSSKPLNQIAYTLDPDNKLLWRFRRKRLEAEAIRDSILSISGRLNLKPHGLPIFPPLPGDIEKRVKYDKSKWDTQYGPEGRRRSIYIYQQRTLSMPFLQVHDALVCDESRPRRRASVTPLQALAMYNSEFIHEEAMHFAIRIQKEAGKDRGRQIRHAFLMALGRPPSQAEASRMEQFLQSSTAKEPLVGLARILLNTNELVHLD